MIRPLAGALVAALALSLPAQATHTTRSESKRYTQTAGDLIVLSCDSEDETFGGMGGVCFTLVGTERQVQELRIQDETGLPVGGYYEFTDQVGLDTGTVLASGSFCRRTTNLQVPPRAAALVVYVDGPVFGPLDCVPQGLGAGFRGRIHATYTVKHA